MVDHTTEVDVAISLIPLRLIPSPPLAGEPVDGGSEEVNCHS